jgi:omega-6 fatty acid desaturase (delta-12 desaturase)
MTVKQSKNKKEIKEKRNSRVNDLSRINNEDFVAEYEANYAPPSFTLKELRDSIPPHLFDKSLLVSAFYVLMNLLACSALFYASTYIDLLPMFLAVGAWPAYWWFQGVFGTGLWVLAHNCGHNSLSNFKILDDFLGITLHSLLLVPYFPWKISHALHHASTGNIETDQVYIPKKRKEIRPKEPSRWQEAIEASPLYVIFSLSSYLILGWPGYVIANVSGHKYPVFTSHFSPSAPIFQKKHRSQVLVSDVALVLVLCILAYWTHSTSFWTVFKYYWVPYLLVNAWLVTITYLNHTDVYLPHYEPSSWDFVRGALTTVDRDFGPFLNTAFHHVHDNHVAHHLFSGMAHYNAVKATPYLRAKLGEYYLYDRTPIWKALYRAAKNCILVEDSGDVLFYHKK